MPGGIHLSAPIAYASKRAGVPVHRADVEPAEIRLWDDVPVTTIERRPVDLSRSADPSLIRASDAA